MTDPVPRVPNVSFKPPSWLRNPHLQSILPSLWSWRVPVLWRARRLRAASRHTVLECAEGVRLQAFIAQQPQPSAPWIMLLHGWLGHAESSYVLSLSSYLFERGYSVVRLNLRDHGDTEHLNPGLFHSCRLAEVVSAVQVLQARYQPAALSLAGFSLGGNFALRVAAQAPQAELRLKSVAAVCPALNPHASDAALAAGWPVYKQYFLNKWKQSLKRKQQLFAEHYELDAALQLNSITQLTDELVKQYAGFAGVRDYYDGYSLLGERLANLTLPCHLLLSADDPIVPIEDAQYLPTHPLLHVDISQYGGHCGFIQSWWRERWVNRWVVQCLEQTATQSQSRPINPSVAPVARSANVPTNAQSRAPLMDAITDTPGLHGNGADVKS